MARGGASVEALESVYRAGLSKFVRAASAVVGDEAAGTDAVQEAFVQAVRKRATFRGDAPLEAWVWRIVINEACRLRARRDRQREEEREHTPPGANHLPEDDAAVRGWVASLPERQRLVVFLRYFADLDYQSIATALEIEVGTVSATLAAAHAALRRSYEEALR